MAINDPRFDMEHELKIPKVGGYWALEHIGKISGGTSTSDFVTTYTPDTKFINFYCQSAAVSGDARGAYIRLRLSGAGSGAGEAVRAYTEVTAALTAGTTCGIHATLELGAAGSQSGQSAAARLTLTAAAATKTLTGTYSVLLLDSSFATGNTVDGQKVSYIRCTDLDSVQMPYLFDFSGLTAADSAATIQADTGAVGSVYGYARVLCPGGAVGYIPIYSSHS